MKRNRQKSLKVAPSIIPMISSNILCSFVLTVLTVLTVLAVLKLGYSFGQEVQELRLLIIIPQGAREYFPVGLRCASLLQRPVEL